MIRIPARLRRTITLSAFIPSDLRSSAFPFLLCEPLWLCASVVQCDKLNPNRRNMESAHEDRGGGFLLSVDAGGDDRGGRQPGCAAGAGAGRRPCGVGRVRG